ncbi:endonuclease, Z1 domain-containing protein [Clostridium putrefaciens]|uniref:Endonuclease, Z1 domain-containing protein n=1 Tax=Clostridium putrefaciens TaxID=99675 RepID=A0A381J5U4_9CLOT|nr:Z1 domain-containing protein [Clostridium putrefaciens]SUY46611.1 endonuclease, Z1 domain-containing protein [Clostridium putrefaciens]
MIKGEYYTKKYEETGYSEELKQCIEEACSYCIENIQSNLMSGNRYYKGDHPLMLFGKIQSGKTRAFTGLMALAFDNNFDYVFILTKNSKALVEQTYKRMRKEFKHFINEDKIDVNDIMKLQDELTPYELEKKLIFIAKKQKDNLGRICDFINDYMIDGTKNCLIIDDEADTTGIGFEKEKDTDEFNLRTVAAEVDNIRGSLDGYVFVQVTATPYALYLQPDFDTTEIKPIKPRKTVLVPSGADYIGGEYYFIRANESGDSGNYIFEEVDDNEQEIASAQKTDERRFKEAEILIRDDRLPTFRRGLINFIVGGCVLKKNGINKKYAYVLHTATSVNAHTRLANITKILIEQIKECKPEHEEYINKLLVESYNDIKNSVVAFSYNMPSFEEVKNEFFNAFNKGYIKISVINSKDEISKYLDEETGELKLRTPFSVFVGGQILDRGITIPNMIGFYYGRNPKTMQQDTVMQHSRMFGYRGKDLLSITRFYTTRKIYESMIKVTEVDSALREDIENKRFEEGVYFIEKNKDSSNTAKIIPCSPSKISASNIAYLKPYSRILPVGFTPKSKAISSEVVRKVNCILDGVIDRSQREAVKITVDCAEKILSEIYTSLKPDNDTKRFITEDRMVSILKYLLKDNRHCNLIVRRDREMSKIRGNGTYIDAPDNGQDERVIAKKVSDDIPTLILLHEKGNEEDWKYREFWWPIIVVPKNSSRTIYSYPEVGVRVKKKK